MLICLFNSFQDGAIDYNGTVFVILVIILFFSAIGIMNLFLLSHLTILNDGIENRTVLLGKHTFLPFSEIKSIEYRLERSQSDAGYISDGYPVNTINYKNGEKLIISSDTYENYSDLIKQINYAYKNLHEA